MLEEAEKRDHRRLGREMDLFHLQEEAAGLGVLAPEGLDALPRAGGLHAPPAGGGRLRRGQARRSSSTATLWETSGHWEKFREHMFTVESPRRQGRSALKPMNCPGHVQIFKQGIKCYRDLPLRMAEFGSCHRNEPSGALHGLMRVRGFTQDDAHIFCTRRRRSPPRRWPSATCCARVYDDFGFDRHRRQVLRPAADARRHRRDLGQGRGAR